MEVTNQSPIVRIPAKPITNRPIKTGVEALLLRGKPRTFWDRAFKRLIRNRLAVVGAVVVIIFIAFALLAEVIAPNGSALDYSRQNIEAINQLPGSEEHFLGTDPLGRDMFSRLIHGGRVSLIVGVFSQLIVVAIGIPIGAAAGYFGGKVDMYLMRFVDVMYTFPTLLFVILLMSTLGPGLTNIFIALGITGWIGLARQTRAQFLALRQRDFVQAARCIGARDSGIMLNHILPNALAPLIVAITFGVPLAIFTEASLSYIGAGISPPTPSWGQMVSDGQQYMRSYWHLGVLPALAISLTMLGFTFFGDGLRDALDPRMAD